MKWVRVKTTLPLFLALWAVLMWVLVGVSDQGQIGRVGSIMNAARYAGEMDYLEIWAGGAEGVRKPVILMGRLDNDLGSYDGVSYFRFYDAQGQEITRSQMASGMAGLPGTGVYDWYFLLDPVLSEDEQLTLAQRLWEDVEVGYFKGSEDGLHGGEPIDGRRCEVTGVVDAQRQVVYPQTITYVYADREITVLDSASDFFDGKECTTITFSLVRLTSALTGTNAAPEEMLRRWQEAEEKAERLLAWNCPRSDKLLITGEDAHNTPIGQGAVMISAYSYSSLRLIAQQLWLTAAATLLAAVAMALYTDYKQRRAIRRERDFTRAAAHELKTPLAILRTHAEALREDIAPAKREQYLDIVLDESDRMAQLVSRLLELSRLESGVELNLETVDLAALIREVWAPLKLQLEQKEITLVLELEELRIQGDGERLREAVENLASNALRYCEKGKSIRVSLTQTGGFAFLRVYNDGPAIPEEDLPRLFEPFYRGDKSRNRQSGGTGLGLAIVRRIVGAHGGSCAAENLAQGPCFRISLPLRGKTI